MARVMSSELSEEKTRFCERAIEDMGIKEEVELLVVPPYELLPGSLGMSIRDLESRESTTVAVSRDSGEEETYQVLLHELVHLSFPMGDKGNAMHSEEYRERHDRYAERYGMMTFEEFEQKKWWDDFMEKSLPGIVLGLGVVGATLVAYWLKEQY